MQLPTLWWQRWLWGCTARSSCARAWCSACVLHDKSTTRSLVHLFVIAQLLLVGMSVCLPMCVTAQAARDATNSVAAMNGSHKHCRRLQDRVQVAMNSKRPNTLVALLIASNFAEIKGTIFKRWDSSKLFTFSCQVHCRS
jgi:Eukaryotic membrane protein family